MNVFIMNEFIKFQNIINIEYLNFFFQILKIM